MDATSTYAELAKYEQVVQLAKAQLDALKADDFAAFDQALDEKGDVIASLTTIPDALRRSIRVSQIVQQVQAIDRECERLLYKRSGAILSEMSCIHQQRHARQAYRTGNRNSVMQRRGVMDDKAQIIDFSL